MVHIGTTTQQEAGYVQVALLSCDRQRCHAIVRSSLVRVGPVTQQETDHVHVAQLSRYVQGCKLLIRVNQVNVVACQKKLLHLIKLIASTCDEQPNSFCLSTKKEGERKL
jgi:hypothetical protein